MKIHSILLYGLRLLQRENRRDDRLARIKSDAEEARTGLRLKTFSTPTTRLKQSSDSILTMVVAVRQDQPQQQCRPLQQLLLLFL
jgi:hypothetical protein